MPVLHWHGDTFDLPTGAVLLAGSNLYPHQAFSIGSAVLGLQFHAEADPARIEQRLIGHAADVGGKAEPAAAALLNSWLDGWC